MKILGYTYQADAHCIECAVKRFGVNILSTLQKNKGYGVTHHLTDGATEQLDNNLIPLEACDSEGNRVCPIFSTHKQVEPLYCGTCRARIE